MSSPDSDTVDDEDPNLSNGDSDLSTNLRDDTNTFRENEAESEAPGFTETSADSSWDDSIS